MNRNEKAAVYAGTQTSGNSEIKSGKRQDFGYTNSITNNSVGQGLIERYLRNGRENAIKKRDLLQLTGFKSIRELRSEIEYERKHGALILSDRGADAGYFLPAEGERGREELRRFIASYMAQAVSMLHTIEAARRALACDPEQEGMFLE